MTVNLGKGVEFWSKSKQNKIEDWTMSLEIHVPILSEPRYKKPKPRRAPTTVI